MVGLGMAAGLLLSYRRARRAGLNGAKIIVGGLGVILVGLAGARLGIVILDWRRYSSDWQQIFSLYGTGFQGGLVVGILAAFALARVLRVSFWGLADLFAPGLALGQAIGRVGCLLNGCCYGRPTDSFLAMYLPDWGGEWAWRYPTQIMHSAANLLILALLLSVDKHKPFKGFVFLLYALLYSTQRLLIDFLRATGPTVAGLRATQVMSAATILVTGIVLGWKWARARS